MPWPRCETNQREPDDVNVKRYMDGCFKEAGLVGLFGLESVDMGSPTSS